VKYIFEILTTIFNTEFGTVCFQFFAIVYVCLFELTFQGRSWSAIFCSW